MIIMISEEHWKMKSEGIWSLQIKGYEKGFCDFCFMGIHACQRKIQCYSALK